MYAIREDPQQARLCVTLSGRVPTDEALRAVRQASVLVQTDGLREVVCDVSMLERGPGRLLLLAGILANEFPANARLAIRSGDYQLRLAQRFLRFSGLGSRVRCFTESDVAEEWLIDQRPAPRSGLADARHSDLLAADVAQSRPVRQDRESVGPAA